MERSRRRPSPRNSSGSSKTTGESNFGRPTRLRTRLIGLLAPLRVRLLALIAISAIPLLVMAGTIAWQNYRLVLDRTAEDAAELREAAGATQRAALDGADQFLRALAADFSGDGDDTCADRLDAALALQSTRYAELALLSPDGGVLCRAVDVPRPVDPPRALTRTLPSGVTTLGPVETRKGGLATIPVFFRPASGTTIFYAALRIDALAGAGLSLPARTSGEPGPAVWLADPGDQVYPVHGSAKFLPLAPILRQLLASPSTATADAAAGAAFCYASSSLSQGYRLVVAIPAAADRARARAELAKRTAWLAAVTALGLGALAIGVHRAITGPVRALAGSVEQWRGGAPFDISALRHAPAELYGLARTFADATSALERQTAELAAATERQALLMREIHHRVKNNLQIIASLLNLQAARIRAPEARAEFSSARDRVRALATLHRHLYAEGELHTIDMRPFLTELLDQLREAMSPGTKDRVAVALDASEVAISSDQAVPLALIVTEAVSNALKYAFPDGRAGHVAVRLSAAAGDRATLVIEDDGVGIPPGQADTPTGKRDGLGLQLIRGFARQLGAELTIERERGTKYTLHLALAAPPGAPPAS